MEVALSHGSELATLIKSLGGIANRLMDVYVVKPWGSMTCHGAVMWNGHMAVVETSAWGFEILLGASGSWLL